MAKDTPVENVEKTQSTKKNEPIFENGKWKTPDGWSYDSYQKAKDHIDKPKK